MNKLDKLKERAVIIQECWLATCKYCRASAETGHTTEHTCVAKPMIRMHNEVLKALSGFSASGSSSVETPKGVEDLIAHLPRPYLHMLSSAVTQYMENTEDVYDTNDPMPTSLASEMVAADTFLDVINASIAAIADAPAGSALSDDESAGLASEFARHLERNPSCGGNLLRGLEPS